jgi:hypothetical protein
MVHRCVGAGLGIGEIPVQLSLRQAGESKISRAEIGKAIVALGRLSAARAAARLGGHGGAPSKDDRR